MYCPSIVTGHDTDPEHVDKPQQYEGDPGFELQDVLKLICAALAIRAAS